MEKSATAQEKANFNFLSCQEHSLSPAIERDGACDRPRPNDGENERFQPGFMFPLACDQNFLLLQKRAVSARRCVWMERSAIFLVFPRVQARCRSQTDRSIKTFKRVSSIHSLGRCVQPCKNAGPGQVVCATFPVDRVRPVTRAQWRSLYCCTCERKGSRRSKRRFTAVWL